MPTIARSPAELAAHLACARTSGAVTLLHVLGHDHAREHHVVVEEQDDDPVLRG